MYNICFKSYAYFSSHNKLAQFAHHNKPRQKAHFMFYIHRDTRDGDKM